MAVCIMVLSLAASARVLRGPGTTAARKVFRAHGATRRDSVSNLRLGAAVVSGLIARALREGESLRPIRAMTPGRVGSGFAFVQFVAQTTPTVSVPAAYCGWQSKAGHQYKVAELAEEWNVSADFIRDLFRDEVGVIRWVRNRPGKRRYIVIRIPADTAERVYRRAQRA